MTTGAHIAFSAPDAGGVERWHVAAVRNGGTDNSPPGLRPEYSGQYFAAFALDPDGNNVEAVFYVPHPGHLVCLECKAAATVRPDDYRAMARLRDARGKQFVAGVVIYTGAQTRALTGKIWAVPVSALWAP